MSPGELLAEGRGLPWGVRRVVDHQPPAARRGQGAELALRGPVPGDPLASPWSSVSEPSRMLSLLRAVL